MAEPPGIHLALNPSHEQTVERYCTDLREAVAEVRSAKKQSGKVMEQTY
jgi:hypothetical protein